MNGGRPRLGRGRSVPRSRSLNQNGWMSSPRRPDTFWQRALSRRDLTLSGASGRLAKAVRAALCASPLAQPFAGTASPLPRRGDSTCTRSSEPPAAVWPCCSCSRTGCMTWRTVAQPVPAAVSQHPNQRLRLRLVDGKDVVVDSARSVAEGLIGYQRQGILQFPVAQVSSVGARRFDADRTVFIVVVGLGAVVTTLVAISAAIAER